ncbi:DNA replication and repair protein RecF, partial [candidate division KSB1 bacterium]|nr:DNA replication and repair protein RecF [candidate division KSB1 bacterium]
MFLATLELTDFRNYRQATIDFLPDKNILFGENAQGKTNILEAIYLLCFSRSFRAQNESEIIHFGKDKSAIAGQFENDLKICKQVTLRYSKGEGKKILVDDKAISRYSDLLGQFPIVLSTPDDIEITSGTPAARRKFVDAIICQGSKTYLKTLQHYIRILKQRNKILSNITGEGVTNNASLVPWDENLIKYGSIIIKFRHNFVSEFFPLLNEIYLDLNESNERLSFSYNPSFAFSDPNETESNFNEQI